MITLDDAREAMWRVLNGMGYFQEANERLVSEVDAVLESYSTDEAHDAKTAEWESLDDCMSFCSNCMSLGCFSKYCPNCGARMVNSK